MQMDANASIDALVTAGCVPLAALAAAFLAGSLAAATVEAVLVRCTGAGVWRWSPAPRGLRRIASALWGVGRPATCPSAVHADTDPTPPRSCPPLCVPGLDGLRLPDLPASNPRPEAPAHRPVR